MCAEVQKIYTVESLKESTFKGVTFTRPTYYRLFELKIDFCFIFFFSDLEFVSVCDTG